MLLPSAGGTFHYRTQYHPLAPTNHHHLLAIETNFWLQEAGDTVFVSHLLVWAPLSGSTMIAFQLNWASHLSIARLWTVCPSPLETSNIPEHLHFIAFYANIWRDNKNIFLKWIWWRMLPSLKIVERSQARVRGILYSGIKYHLRIEMQRLREIWLSMIFSSICLNTKSSQHCWRTLKSGRIWSRSWNLPYKAETGMNLCQAMAEQIMLLCDIEMVFSDIMMVWKWRVWIKFPLSPDQVSSSAAAMARVWLLLWTR